MLTFTGGRGDPVAVYKNSKGKNKIISYISPHDIEEEDDEDFNLGNADVKDSLDTAKYGGDMFRKLIRSYREKAKQNCKDILDGEDCDDPFAKIIVKKMEKESKKDIKFKTKGCMFLPDMTKRNIVYVAGPSGSGKSYVSAEYCRCYNMFFPKRQIFLFSKKGQDPAFDVLPSELGKNIFIRIDPQDIVNEQEVEARLAFLKVNDPEKYEEYLDEEKHEDLLKLAIRKYKKKDYEIDYKAFKNSLCVFDDTHTFTKGAKDLIGQLQKDCMDLGRAANIEMVVTNHLLTEGHKTRNVLNELTKMVLFPEGSSYHQLKYVLDKQFGYDKDKVKKICQIKSRWVCLSRLPRYIVHEKGILLDKTI